MAAGPQPVPAAVHEVGPGKPLAEPGDVPWESLVAGDTVLIHWRTNAYRSKWVICRQGTSNAPIVVRGMPGPAGELPVMDGNAATTRPVLNYWNQPRGVLKIGGANIPPDTTPAHITIEGLEIRGARPPYAFTAANGTVTSYPNNAAAVYVEKGEHIVIRDCVFRDCGNGLFVAAQSRDVLVEGNDVYDNGNEGSIYEHNSYTAAVGITFQHNRYGPLRAGCLGNNLKDRSAGLVVRYNWIEGGNRQLDLVDAEDDPAIQNDPRYRATHVYGNLLIESDGAGNRQVVHYGGDSGNTAIYRKGTLYFYQNTIVSTRTDRTTLFRLSTNEERCDCRNNIIWVSAAGTTLSLLDDTGYLALTHNWLKPGWVQSFGGTGGTLVDDGSNLAGATPGFLDEAGQNFRLTAASACIDAGTNLHPAVLPAHDSAREYLKHRAAQDRRKDPRLDLGAYEFSPWQAWLREHFGAGYETAAAAAEHADSDGDHLPTLLEYAFRTDPHVASRDGAPGAQILADAGARFGAVRFARRLPPSELAYTVQTSTDLAHWSDGSFWSDAGFVLSNAYTTAVLTGETTVVRATAPIIERTPLFFRVRVARD